MNSGTPVYVKYVEFYGEGMYAVNLAAVEIARRYIDDYAIATSTDSYDFDSATSKVNERCATE